MKKTAFWTVTAGAALLAACGQRDSSENAAGNATMESRRANMAAPIELENLSDTNNMNATGETVSPTGAPSEDRAELAPKARAEAARPAPRERPAERPAPRPAPKQEPAPPANSTCTPEHEAMGHCKQ